MNAVPSFLDPPVPHRQAPAERHHPRPGQGPAPSARCAALLERLRRRRRRLEARLGHRLPRPGLSRPSSRCSPSTACSGCAGGTLLEVAWQQGAVEGYLDWAPRSASRAWRCPAGSAAMTRGGQARADPAGGRAVHRPGRGRRQGPRGRRRARRVGGRGAAPTSTPARPGSSPRAGSPGPSGMFEPDGSVRGDVVDAVVAAVGVETDGLRGAAQGRSRPGWSGGSAPTSTSRNIAPADALGVEALRLGLRADTFDASASAPHRRCPGAQPVTTIPDRYREVSVTDVDVPLEAELAARAASVARRSTGARRTSWSGTPAAPRWSRSVKQPSDELFWRRPRRRGCSPARTRPRGSSGPTLDTGDPSRPGPAPRPTSPARRCVVRARAATATSASCSTARRCGCTSWTSSRRSRPSCSTRCGGCSTRAEDLPAVAAGAARSSTSRRWSRPARPATYLLPCRGGGIDGRRARPCHYLDEVPPRAGLDAARLRPLPRDPPGASTARTCRQVDICPRRLAARRAGAGEVLLTKCCLLEEHVETDGRVVVVPWGASFGHLRRGARHGRALGADARQ